MKTAKPRGGGGGGGGGGLAAGGGRGGIEPSDGGRKRFLRSARLRGAIEFLTSIPLGTGGAPVVSGGDTTHAAALASLSSPKRGEGLDDRGGAGGGGGAVSPSKLPQAPMAAMGARSAAAATLGGTSGAAVILSGRPFRHVTSRGLRSSRAFRDALLRDGVLDGRIVFARNKEYPSAVFSVVKYDAAAEHAYRRDRLVATAGSGAGLLLEDTAESDASLPMWLRWKGRSYAKLVRPERPVVLPPTGGGGEAAAALAVGIVPPQQPPPTTRGAGGGGGGGVAGDEGTDALTAIGSSGADSVIGGSPSSSGGGPQRAYSDPFALDDPTIGLDKQRFGYRREGYAVSILVFRHERSVKDDINAKFASAHPWLDHGDGQSLTLSKIRALKRSATNAWWGRGRDMSTVALAIVYFERLVFSRRVNKGNRKLAMAVCLLLAYKMNEAREGEGGDASARTVAAELEAAFGVTRKALLAAEFSVFVHLGFSLASVPAATVSAHLERCYLSKGVNMGEVPTVLTQTGGPGLLALATGGGAGSVGCSATERGAVNHL